VLLMMLTFIELQIMTSAAQGLASLAMIMWNNLQCLAWILLLAKFLSQFRMTDFSKDIFGQCTSILVAR